MRRAWQRSSNAISSVVGDRIDILSPNLEGAKFTLKEILDEELQPLSCAPHPQQQVYIRCPYPLRPGDLLRRKLD